MTAEVSSDPIELGYFRGRVALAATLKGLDVAAGDDVLTQAFTCVAVPEAIMAVGAAPVYADIESEGVNLDPADLERRITSRTKAIVVQHTFGIPARMAELLDIAKRHGLPVIEDCCHTLESLYDGKKAGTMGVAAFYSYEWGKPIVAGIGGSARVNGSALLTRMRGDYENYRGPATGGTWRMKLQYTAFQTLFRPSWYWQVRGAFRALSKLGVAKGNYNPIRANEVPEDYELRMSQFHRELVKDKMARLEELTAHQRLIAGLYLEGVRNPAIRRVEAPARTDSVYARYPIRVAGKERLLEAARKARIEIADWYTTPVHPLQTADWELVGYRRGSCPNAEKRTSELVSLPVHAKTSRRDADRIISFLNRWSG